MPLRFFFPALWFKSEQQEYEFIPTIFGGFCFKAFGQKRLVSRGPGRLNGSKHRIETAVIDFGF